MKQNVLQSMISFILKYIYLICILLIITELFSVGYTAKILMQQTTYGVMYAVSGEITSIVDNTLRLLRGMAQDKRFTDRSIPLFDRAVQAKPYQDSHQLFMLALTDENVNIVSADEVEPSPPYSLSYRDYMQRLYATGEHQITDVFPAGSDNSTLNYTIVVPIFSEKKVVGSVLGSIYFHDINNILFRNMDSEFGRYFYLLDSNKIFMAGANKELYGQLFVNLMNSSDRYLFGTDVQAIDRSIENGQSGAFWEWGDDGLNYVNYKRVALTNWTLIYRVHFITILQTLLPIFISKIIFYILLCAIVHWLGRRYLINHLAEVNHLINRLARIQKELFQSEHTSYDSILDLTEKGLTDQLTGLSTRAVLFKQAMKITKDPNAYGAVVFLDLDNLKFINDAFGHEAGDIAITHFADTLKQYEQQYNAIAARYGGDEFVLVLNTIKKDVTEKIIKQLCKDLNTFITVNENSVAIHGSIGVSFYPEHGTKLEELICKADLALYSAKQDGKNQAAFYDMQQDMD